MVSLERVRCFARSPSAGDEAAVDEERDAVDVGRRRRSTATRRCSRSRRASPCGPSAGGAASARRRRAARRGRRASGRSRSGPASPRSRAHPIAANSCAACLVSPSTPCFAAVYCGWPGAGTVPAADEMLTIAPPRPCATNWRSSCCMHRNTPVRSTSIVRCQSSSVCSTNGFGVRRDAGVVHRAVEAAEAVDRGAHHRGDGVVVGDVGRDRDRVALDSRASCRSRSPRSTSATTTLAPAPRTAARSLRRCRCPAPVTSATLPCRFIRPDLMCSSRRGKATLRTMRPFSSLGSHVASATTASTIVSIGSHDSSGRSIIAVAPSVFTASPARRRSPRCRCLRARSRTSSVIRSSAALLGAYVDDSACCGPSPGSTIALVMLTIQPAPRRACRARRPSSTGTA